MNAWLRELALCFAAGCAGALAKGAVAWGAYRLGVTVLIGTHGSNALTPGALYPRIVWGGLWAGLFLLPFLRTKVLVGGLLAGAIVTLVQWVLLPLWWQGGFHFAPMPLLDALLLNAIWAVVTALLLKWI